MIALSLIHALPDMASLQNIPMEIINLIVEQLVINIGIQKGLLLRSVSQKFNLAILEAVCVSQVVDIDDPATPDLAGQMHPALRGKILAAKSYTSNHADKTCTALHVLTNVNSTLDRMIGETTPELVKVRHEAVAATININVDDEIDARIEAQNLLCGASIIGDLAVLKLVLEGGKTITLPAALGLNASSPYFDNHLSLAAGFGRIAILQYFLDHGARVDSMSNLWHSHDNHYQIFSELQDWNNHGENDRYATLDQEHPGALRAAVYGGHDVVVHLLLQPRYHLQHNSMEYLRAILAGAKSGRLKLIKLMFEVIGKNVSDFRELGNEMLWAAAYFGHSDIVHWLLDNGVDVNATTTYHEHTRPRRDGALGIAARRGHTSMVRLLIERAAVVNVDRMPGYGRVPIENASEYGQEEAMKVLLRYGADPCDALPAAAFGGQARLVMTLLSEYPGLIHKGVGGDRNKGGVGRLALRWAMAIGNLTIITMLVEAGVPLNDGYHKDAQPLNYAQSYGYPWVVPHLLWLGAREDDPPVFIPGSWDLPESRRCLVSERTWEWIGKY
jgi:ankyrin repeat protein